MHVENGARYPFGFGLSYSTFEYSPITLSDKAGESREIDFEIKEETLSFYRKDFTFGIEPGDFQLFIGTNSTSLQSATFRRQ